MKDVDAVEQVFPECFAANQFPRDRDGAVTSRASNGCSLSPPRGRTVRSCSARRSFAWYARRYFADLVEQEEGSTARFDEKSGPRNPRVGEGAADMPKKFALEQVLRHGRAVDRNEGAIASPTGGMDRFGHELLARTAFARNEDVRLRIGDAIDKAAHFRHCGAATHELVLCLR